MVTSVELFATVKAVDIPVPIFGEACKLVVTLVELLDKLLVVKPKVPVPPREIFWILTVGTLVLTKTTV